MTKQSFLMGLVNGSLTQLGLRFDIILVRYAIPDQAMVIGLSTQDGCLDRTSSQDTYLSRLRTHSRVAHLKPIHIW